MKNKDVILSVPYIFRILYSVRIRIPWSRWAGGGGPICHNPQHVSAIKVDAMLLWGIGQNNGLITGVHL